MSASVVPNRATDTASASPFSRRNAPAGIVVSSHRTRSTWRAHAFALPVAVVLFVALGAGLRVSPSLSRWSATAWLVGLVVSGAPVVWRTLRAAAAGHFAT